MLLLGQRCILRSDNWQASVIIKSGFQSLKMSFFQKIKSFFSTKRLEMQPDPHPTDAYLFDAAAYASAHEAYVVKHDNDIDSESEKFVSHYGEFHAFFYRENLDAFLRNEVLFFRETDNQFNDFLDDNHWQQRHPFNFPGPFYTGESDSCGTGIVEAPKNVMNDAYCREYVFRQPKNFKELLRVLDAAAVEVFDSYSSNGNDYWTYDACKEWWSNRAQLIVALRDEELLKMNEGQAQAYTNYLNGEAELDLRRYCYFLLNGSYPMSETTVLPSL
jgi:hypothetical protein